MNDISDTTCPRSCCWTPFGACAAQYRCHHHRTDYDRVRARTMASATFAGLRFPKPHVKENRP